MKVIGERVSILEKDDVFSLVILPTTDKRKLALMFFWLLAWSVCGVIVFVNLFKIQGRDAKLFVAVYLTFWFYYEFKIAKAFIWKRWGKEKLWVKKGVLYYQREVQGKGKIQEFNLELVNNFDIIESSGGFAEALANSFWVKGNERLEFQSQSKAIRFGLQLNDEEAKKILKELKKFLKK
jgi:hypothetical protein